LYPLHHDKCSVDDPPFHRRIVCQIESILQCELHFLDFQEDLRQDSTSDCEEILFENQRKKIT